MYPTRRAQRLDHNPAIRRGSAARWSTSRVWMSCPGRGDLASRCTQHAGPSDSHARASLWENIRLRHISTSLGRVGLTLPSIPPTVIDGTPVRNKDLPKVISEFVRRIPISFPRLVELMRSPPPPTTTVLTSTYCPTFSARRVVATNILTRSWRSRIRACGLPYRGACHQHVYPANHESAADRYPVLIKNIRKEHDLSNN
ncbi:hypothetical protein PR003_g10068 [Phytophthora rubi]|uniref:Uncharacterized protein n=1 Tax=Phytophthora rubi TaxID=129364 RepID=A0A6A4FSC2_9STRA|nr:hypothetical protein PR003_g10068 [Phytophthora rubi]